MKPINADNAYSIEKYLERINYEGSLSADTDTLINLQLSHLYNIPFENLSIHLKEPILLNYKSLFDKIVLRRRGGFCYELNGLFTYLLRQIGFDVNMLSAGVTNQSGEDGPEFDHLTLMVTLNDRWLVDVGFGDSFRKPLLLDDRKIQHQGERSYKIEEYGDYLLLQEKKPGKEWVKQFRFKLQPHNLNDFEKMCHYHQTSPESKFTQHRICSIARPDGRITLNDMRLIETSYADISERTLESEAEYHSLLKKEFGIIVQNLSGRQSN